MFVEITKLAPFVVLVMSSLSVSRVSPCSLIINELQLAVLPQVSQEFIELSTDCPLPLDLTPYSLVLWRSNKDPSKMDLKSQARFAATTGCRSLTKQYLVIGSPSTAPHRDSQFCLFSEFGNDWKKEQNAGYIDKGNDKTNALVLYQDLPADGLQVSQTFLNNDTAHRDQIVDVVFFANKGKYGDEIRKLLIPEYDISTSDHAASSIYFRLTESDDGKVTAEAKRSFSFCCSQDRVMGRWPMGFKYSKPTPGQLNNCSTAYNFCLDGAHGTYHAGLDRCDVDLITNCFKNR